MSSQSVDPSTGCPFGPVFPDSDSTEYLEVVAAAGRAARPWAAAPADVRAASLRAIANGLAVSRERLVSVAARETGMAESRLVGELERTCLQLHMFADLVDGGSLAALLVDVDGDTSGQSGVSQLRKVVVPIGPVAVFGASNFPFAFGVIGGDSASALAAGCPVVAKAHPAHPQLSEAIGSLVTRILAEIGAPDGTFGLLRGFDVGTQLVADPGIRAAAFTGSGSGGRALFDRAVARPDPIPFYGEFGSVNPVFATEAGAQRDGFVSGFLDSMTLGVGQFCTKPGVLVVPRSAWLIPQIRDQASGYAAGLLLHAGIASQFRTGLDHLTTKRGVEVLAGAGAPTGQESFAQAPVILRADVTKVLGDPSILEAECFGPVSVVVEYEHDHEAIAVSEQLSGCLVAAVHGDVSEPLSAILIERLARVAGRVVWNGWPTGVAVAAGQHHGGPWPATTNALFTSVGPAAILRFLRPIALQDVPREVLPAHLRGWGPPRVDDN
jgi:NADP-dependent aldehyde dehydrogenase